MRYWLPFISLLLLGEPASPAAEPKGELVDRIVAVVNGKPLLKSDLDDALLRAREEIAAKGTAAAPTDLDRRVLDQLVNNVLVETEIERRGLAANDGVVDGAIATVMKQNGMKSLSDLTKALKAEGMALEEYRSTLKKQIETSRLISEAIRPKVQVSDQDIAAEHRRTQDSKADEKLVHLKMIVKKTGNPAANRKAAERLLRQIKAGIPFEKTADRETEGPGKGEGGDIGAVSAAGMQPELRKVIETMKPGDISNVVTTPQGSYLLLCVEFVKASAAPLTESEKNDLRDKLTNLETERAFDGFVRDLRARAQIEILP